MCENMSVYIFALHPGRMIFHSGCNIFDASLTFFGHSYFQALLQPAVLAAVARHFVNDAVLLPVAGVHHVLLDTSPEETLQTDKHAMSGATRNSCLVSF